MGSFAYRVLGSRIPSWFGAIREPGLGPYVFNGTARYLTD